MLRVPSTASSSDIRRAYYRESKRCHPDKVGEDPVAVDRFRHLSEAYQVLRSVELRRAYDAGGEEAVERLNSTVDLGSLYATTLCSSGWEPFFGQLALSWLLAGSGASDMDDSVESGTASLDALAALFCVTVEPKDKRQIQREVRCAANLAARLAPAVDVASTTSIAETVAAEARAVADFPFAPALLETIATTYESEADIFLGTVHPLNPCRELKQAAAQGKLLAQQARTTAVGVRAGLALRSLLVAETPVPTEQTNNTPLPGTANALCLERAEVQSKLPVLVQALWHVTLLDIEGTLRRSCGRVLHDSSVALDGRVARARALRAAAASLRAVAAEAAPRHGVNGSVPKADEDFLRQKVLDAAMKLSSRGSAAGPYAAGCAE